MYKIVIDTNVIVSALLNKNSASPPVKILDHLFNGKFIPIYNDEVFLEYENVLSRLKFNFEKQEIANLLALIKHFGINTRRTLSKVIFTDISDIVFYELALTHHKNKAYLVTGNLKHFPNEPFIVNPAKLLSILEQE